MDRPIVYSSEQGRSTDFLFGQRAAMIALSKLIEAVYGTTTLVTGLAVAPTSPASMSVAVSAGQIFALEPLDATAYGILAADTAHSIVKQGLLMDAVNLACPAPGTAGYSINYLIQATYQDSDTTNVVLPYFNSANPSQPLSGQSNSGAAQPTERQGLCVVAVKAGAAATTGTQTTPAPDAGYVGLAVVTVANGATTIIAGNIAIYGSAPYITETLTQKISQATGDARYALIGSITSKLQPVTASVASNALTLTLNPTSLDFRSSSLGSGAVNTRTISAPISVIVPSGATLGTVNATEARLAILAMDNAGTVELAVVNLAGGNNLDETTLISTTAISASATANNIIYSTTARTSLPFRVVGFVDITEATAGTWATAPSTIQGAGGIDLSGFTGIGSGIGLSLDGTQSLANNVETDVNWQTEDFKDANFTHAANGSTVTINKSGRYLVTTTVAFSTSLAGNYGSYIFQNGVRRSANYAGYASSGGGQMGTGTAYLNCIAGDVIKIVAIQASGGAVTLSTNSHVGIVRVR